MLVPYYFMLHGNEESIIDVAELDGFCAALACSPDMIMASTWNPAIWGGEALMPEWESIEEAQEFNDLLFFVYNQVIGSFNEDDFAPFFYIREVENKTITIVDEWCRGFLRGVNLWGPLSEKDARIVEKELEPIRLFATPQGLEQLNQMNDLEIEQKQDLILPATNTLFKHFLKQRKTPVTHTEPKVGRNDPCPCGSGKKYKKCCLH